MVFAGYPEYEQAEYALTYGYIDHTAGMTLEVMAAAIRREDGKGVRLEDMNLQLASKIRIGVAKDKDCYILDDKLTQTSHTENIPYALINQLELNVESHSRTLLCTQTTHPKSGQIVQESFQERFDQQDF